MTSSSKRFLTVEELSRVQQWRPPTLFDPAPTPELAEPAPPEPEEVPQEQARPPTAEQLEAIHKQAYQEGFEQGREKGLELGHREALEEGRRQAASRRARLDQILAALDTPFKELDVQVEQELLILVVNMVRQLVRREVRTDPHQIAGVLREALGILPVSSRNVRVLLHPEDAAIVRELYLKGEGGRNWQVVEDPVLQRGGCRVLTDTSQIDATLESRLNNLIAPLLGGLRTEDHADAEPEA